MDYRDLHKVSPVQEGLTWKSRGQVVTKDRKCGAEEEASHVGLMRVVSRPKPIAQKNFNF